MRSDNRASEPVTHIGLVAMRAYAIASSRLPLLWNLTLKGTAVHVGAATDASVDVLQSQGAHHSDISFSQGGIKPARDLLAGRQLIRFLKRHQLAYVHAFGMKPVVFTGLTMALRLVCIQSAIATVTGLGTHRRYLTTPYMRPLVRLAMRPFSRVIFQNTDDQLLFEKHGLVTNGQSRVILGAGVDIERFSPTASHVDPCSPPRVVLISRLLKSKGIESFARIAARVHEVDHTVEFELYGEYDAAHPNAVSLNWLESCTSFHFRGRTDDVPNVLAACDVFLFPSTYGEGVPRVVMEAAAMGVPTVAFDVPGVREAVIHHDTGFLVPPDDEATMVARLLELVHDRSKRARFGAGARQLALERFDVDGITEQYLDVYRDVGFLRPEEDSSAKEGNNDD